MMHFQIQMVRSYMHLCMYLCIRIYLQPCISTRFIHHKNYIIYNYANFFTDHHDAVAFEMLSRLLYPRGIGKKAVFIAEFVVSVTIITITCI